MPYKIKGKCIYKKDTNKKVGCTTGSVKKYMKALHANVKESLDEIPAGPEEEPSSNNTVGEHYRFDKVIESEGMQKVVYKCTHSNAQFQEKLSLKTLLQFLLQKRLKWQDKMLKVD